MYIQCMYVYCTCYTMMYIVLTCSQQPHACGLKLCVHCTCTLMQGLWTGVVWKFDYPPEQNTGQSSQRNSFLNLQRKVRIISCTVQ